MAADEWLLWIGGITVRNILTRLAYSQSYNEVVELDARNFQVISEARWIQTD